MQNLIYLYFLQGRTLPNPAVGGICLESKYPRG